VRLRVRARVCACVCARRVAQDAMNVFLGVYKPWLHTSGHLWDIESDAFLHNARVAHKVAASTLPRSVADIVNAVCSTWWSGSVRAFSAALQATGVGAMLAEDGWVIGWKCEGVVAAACLCLFVVLCVFYVCVCVVVLL
jgi:hypothetical protein